MKKFSNLFIVREKQIKKQHYMTLVRMTYLKKDWTHQISA